MKHNFSPGPSILNKDVIKQAAKGVINLNNSDLSILEISHRGELFSSIIEEACELVKEICGLTSYHHIMFLQGGATTQFAMLPLNFLDKNENASYINTGIWSTKAIKEAANFGNVDVVASSEEDNFNHIPLHYNLSQSSKYLHITSNNTIYGTQYQNFPDVNVPLVVDMSSDIMSKEIDFSQFDLIYAGAQKNIGPAGTTLVIIKDDFLNSIQKTIPAIWDYRTHVAKGSMFNTPPVFAVYVCWLNLKWIKSIGGLSEIEILNNEKASLLYSTLDKSELFSTQANKSDRSKMNVTFFINKPELEQEFLNFANNAEIVGIKGHRTVGGFRASIYNALPLSSVKVLVNVIEQFEQKFG